MQDILLFMQNHWTLSLALIIVLILLMIMEFSRLKRDATNLSAMQAVNLINRQNAAVVDVRNAEAYSSGHIVEAISLPANEIEEKYRKLEKFKSQPIILVCATGTDSPAAAIKLQNLGFNVHVLAGGIRAWRTADMPIVKG